MSISKFKREFSEMISPLTKKNQETNLSATIIDSANDLAKKYNFKVEYFNSEHIDYGQTQKNKINILNDKEKNIGTIILNIYRNEHGTYEYNGYFSEKIDKKLKM